MYPPSKHAMNTAITIFKSNVFSGELLSTGLGQSFCAGRAPAYFFLSSTWPFSTLISALIALISAAIFETWSSSCGLAEACTILMGSGCLFGSTTFG